MPDLDAGLRRLEGGIYRLMVLAGLGLAVLLATLLALLWLVSRLRQTGGRPSNTFDQLAFS